MLNKNIKISTMASKSQAKVQTDCAICCESFTKTLRSKD